METNILELLNKVWRSNYEHALYFEEQNKENLADTFFDNAKLLEKITEELKKQTEIKTKYIVYPTYYYDNSKMEKLMEKCTAAMMLVFALSLVSALNFAIFYLILK